MVRPGLVVLVGPTAVGKTTLAVEVGRACDAEVVSADSVQVFRGLDIGSAKPTPQERARCPHHLIDVVDPDQEMTAARFAALADQAIADIIGRGKRVLVAGGTGLYVKALLFGLAPAPPVDQALRTRLARQWENEGAQALHARLASLDPTAAARLHPADRQRVLRALEVCLQTGQAFSPSQQAHGFRQPRYPHLVLGLDLPRPELYARIEARCRQMWDQGLLEEVRALLASGVPAQARSLQSLGYRQAVLVLQGRQDQPEALREMIARTKAYARRQLTWFRGVQGINWHMARDLAGVLARVRNFWDL